MPATDKDYEKIAGRHGVDLTDVSPPASEERLEKLKQVLIRTDVPYPISLENQMACLAAAKSGEPFGVGALGEETVDLGEYANFQEYEKYTFEEHLSWACLIAEQQHTKQMFACNEYLEGERLFEIGGAVIPDYYTLNARIYQHTGWQLSTVNMIIPAELFFTCHSQRFFPVTTFMRPLESTYLEEPDIGHDVAGHVATFTIPSVANVMKHHGQARDMIYAERDEKIAQAGGDQDAIGKICDHAEQLLNYAGRIYWFTVEFGLVMQNDELRAFGAGILSSPGETVYSIESLEANRILIDPSCDADLLATGVYRLFNQRVSENLFRFQKFPVAGFTDSRPDTGPFSRKAMRLPDYTWQEIVPGDTVVCVGSQSMSPNEKYYRLMADQPLDECQRRTAIQNLEMYTEGFDVELLHEFKSPPPEVPEIVLEWYRAEFSG